MAEEYEIRYANNKDIPAIKVFINSNWKKDHILVREKGFFEWQYTSDKLDYVIALDKEGVIQGMLGFISYFDGENRDIATSMWKANPGTGFLGVKILMFIQKNENHRTLFSPGINVKTSGGIYGRMNISTGKMNQWYRLNDIKDYKIAKVIKKNIPVIQSAMECKTVQYEDYERFIEDFEHSKYVNRDMVPYKSKEYLKRRYFEHPSYNYLTYGIKPNGTDTTLVAVMRVQECNGSKVIRFVDCIGDYSALLFATPMFDEILISMGAEYIDMYEKGIPENVMRGAGWTLLSETENIIPNYFAPYDQSNVDVYYCTTDENIVLFRGDGDQDRPN